MTLALKGKLAALKLIIESNEVKIQISVGRSFGACYEIVRREVE
jgi:hypothetical protein